MKPLVDAHNHLQDPILQSDLPRIMEDMAGTGIGSCLVIA